MKRKFLVISYDNNEQRSYWDSVMSTGEARAAEFVEKYRPYVIVTDAVDLETLRRETATFESKTPEQVKAHMKDMREQFKRDNDYEPTNYYDGNGNLKDAI